MRAHTDYLWFNTTKRHELINITDRVAEIVAASRVQEGLCLVSAMHITAGIWVNDEESGLKHDVMVWLEELAPAGDYRHHQTGEDNADAHLKRTLVHHQVVLPITKGALDLGPWEQVFYAEFDGRRKKRVVVKIPGRVSADRTVQGTCDPRFAAVRDVFAANLDGGREIGASFAATVDGRPVVDLWGGYADAARTRPWCEDTIVNVFSTTKAMTALCAHRLVDQGLLDVDAPVARYWPEFAQGGKEAIPVRMLLSHTAGLAAVREPLDVAVLLDWDRYAGAIAAQTPWWEPGSANGYHALTYGHLVGEVVRRITGTTVGRFFRDEFAGPLGADFHIGLDPADDARCGEMVGPSAEERAAAGDVPPPPDSLRARVMGNPLVRPEMANTPGWRRAEIPAANGHGNARSVARVLSVLACGGALDGVRRLGGDTIERAIAEQAYDRDLVLGFKIKWGLGFMLRAPELPFGPNPRTAGHGGWGGSLGFADLDARVSWAYVMNKMAPGTAGDTRGFALMMALYGAL